MKPMISGVEGDIDGEVLQFGQRAARCLLGHAVDCLPHSCVFCQACDAVPQDAPYGGSVEGNQVLLL